MIAVPNSAEESCGGNTDFINQLPAPPLGFTNAFVNFSASSFPRFTLTADTQRLGVRALVRMWKDRKVGSPHEEIHMNGRLL